MVSDEAAVTSTDVQKLKEVQKSASENCLSNGTCEAVTQSVNTFSNSCNVKNNENAETLQQNGTVKKDLQPQCNGFSTSSGNGLNGQRKDCNVNGVSGALKQPEPKRPKVESKPKQVECIELDDDDDVIEEPPLKKKKDEQQKSPIPDDPDTERKPELTNSEALLDKLEKYVKDAIESNTNVERKVLDALLGAINIQVQREPLSVRKLILDKQLVLPNTISFPPSQVVDMLIEHDPDAPLPKVINRMFGDERPKLTEAEKRDRHMLKMSHPAPHMTKLLMDIGQDLVQESTYSDIVHAKNLPETPKNMDTYKQVAQQLKPVWEALKKKNECYKLKLYTCQICGYKTESLIVLSHHKQTPHFDGRKYQCGLCPEFFTNEAMISNHYLKQHGLIAGKEEPVPRNPCPCCDEDFMYKGQRDQHLKACRRDLNRVRLIMAPKAPRDISAINQWLWERPPVDPSILQQQQTSQRQQAERQKQLQQQQLAQQRRNQLANTVLLQQQQALLLQQQQQRLRVAHAALTASQQQKMNSIMSSPSLLAAMQQQLRAAAAAGIHAPGLNLFAARAAVAANSLRSPSAPSLATMASRLKNSHLNTSRSSSANSLASSSHINTCEICDQAVQDRERYLTHLQLFHKQMRGKSASDMQQGAPLACSRCRDRFWTYEGLERHLVMAHGLVTSDLLTKAQRKEDGGRCKLCGKQYAFNMLQHLVTDHQVKLCSAEIMYSCDVCAFKCSSYNKLEIHLNTVHPKTPAPNSAALNSTAALAAQGWL
uniref:C2H2-type domain-containing protein n=1 Tax=Syphacia muris TaxID=451379 RepID=A0A0N5B0L8_9BILA